jgi:hypothetical protein
VIDELRALAERMPVPAEEWHPHVALIRRVKEELLDALDEIEQDPTAAAALVQLVERGEPATATTRALAALPVPQGEHPFLDEILPVLDLARLARQALAAAVPA